MTLIALIKSLCKIGFCLQLFRLKYESGWIHMYELAKISINNKGNELKSDERRSNDLSETQNRSVGSVEINQPGSEA